jgi:3-methylcrotonyl-CoA carboxylase alpha subunit
MSDEEAIGPVVTAPMPGQVRSVMVSLGQSVSQGDSLMILEAMKMEHSLKASRDGVVAEVLIEPGQQVAAGDALIRLDEEAG